MTFPSSANGPIAYLVSRFPKISETFILYEILALEQLGVRVELFPLLRHREPILHSEARNWVEKAHFAQPLSPAVWASQLFWLRKSPGELLKTWQAVVTANRSSPKFLLRAVAATLLGAHFARRMLALGVEHIHAHWATHPAVAAYVAHRLTDLPFSFTAHAHDIYVERAMLEQKIDSARFVVTISEFNRRFLADLYGADRAAKVHVIHCGVDTQVFRPPELPRRRQPFTMITVASLEEKKGHHYLIEACALLAKQGIDFHCLLVGEGELRQTLEAQIKTLGLSGRVTLLGHQPRARVNELVATADAMVLPSVRLPSGKQEGIPVSLMEALSVELPVIATQISGVPELIEDGVTGLLVPERNPRALADAVVQLYRSPELSRRLGAAGRQKVLAGFDLKRNAQALLELIYSGNLRLSESAHEPAQLAFSGLESEGGRP